MTLYLLNHFSNVGLVLLIVGGTTALAVLVTIVVHKLFPTKSISGAVDEYVHAVVEDEWPELRWGEQSPRASAALEGLYATVRGFEPHTPIEQTFCTSAVDNLREVTFSRRERIQQSQEGLSPLLRFLLIIGAMALRRRGALERRLGPRETRCPV